MTKDMLGMMVKNRANEIINQRWKALHKAISVALHEFDPACAGGLYSPEINKEGAMLLQEFSNRVLVKDHKTTVPRIHWERRENEVFEDIMKQLDSVQRAMLAREPRPDDEVPSEPQKETTE